MTDQVNEAVAWTDDAQKWGKALNEASWTFIETCPEKSPLLFNTAKGALRAAILRYAEFVAAVNPALAHPSRGVVDEAMVERVAEAMYYFPWSGATEPEKNYWRGKARLALTPLQAAALPAVPAFDMLAHLQRQREWSGRTFGPGPRTAGVIDHIRKELREIEADPTDLSEWIDVVILALDGAWRAGGTPEQIIATLVAKQTKNEGRTWPDWLTVSPDKAIEHDRTQDALPAVPEGMARDLGIKADHAYVDYINQMRRPECLGWDHKVRTGKFTETELRAHMKAGELLGRHRALSEVAAMLAATPAHDQPEGDW